MFIWSLVVTLVSFALVALGLWAAFRAARASRVKKVAAWASAGPDR
ncbi:MAG: hypothetical protein JNL21_20355 [Myxococcales bacterium]|nr:hypothetical protein [Myxococcales bacterium]